MSASSLIRIEGSIIAPVPQGLQKVSFRYGRRSRRERLAGRKQAQPPLFQKVHKARGVSRSRSCSPMLPFLSVVWGLWRPDLGSRPSWFEWFGDLFRLGERGAEQISASTPL